MIISSCEDVLFEGQKPRVFARSACDNKKNNMETVIEIRPYTKSELATLYFPIGSTSNALRRLNRYIHHAHGLLPALLATGYRVNDRHFTRRQVQLIFEYLGEP